MMTMLAILVAGFMFCSAAAASADPERIDAVIDVGKVWSGHPVGFSLLTHDGRQFVAFYDDSRQMTVGQRTLDSHQWTFQRLPSKLGWDSHNSVTMAVDADGHLHLAGNMHCVPLIYFRTSRPMDVTSFQRVESMVGEREKRCTYPKFMRDANGALVFTYRDGSSGNGDQIFNRYDTAQRRWMRLLDSPLTSGEGKMNAYFVGPLAGPDGWFHLCWVWRDTPDCATNHDLCYARSRDMVNWETSDGRKLALPITLKQAEVVDPVPAGGGIINGNTRLGFDTQKRVVLSYHKFDEAGKTQVFNARREADGWRIYRSSDWDYRWEFSGGGSIVFEVRVGPVEVDGAGRLTQSWQHKEYGSALWQLDEATLRPTGKIQLPSPFKAVDAKLADKFPGLQWRGCSDLGEGGEKDVRYVMRWQTLSSNRDRPRQPPLPEASMLRVYKLKR